MKSPDSTSRGVFVEEIKLKKSRYLKSTNSKRDFADQNPSATFLLNTNIHKLSPKMQRVSGCLQKVATYESFGLFCEEVWTHLLFGENVLHAIIYCWLNLCKSMLFLKVLLILLKGEI